MFIFNNRVISFINIFADSCDIEEFKVVSIADEEDTIIFIFKLKFLLKFWSPNRRFVTPSPIPLLLSPRISDFNQAQLFLLVSHCVR
jgi:hypothetical protein